MIKTISFFYTTNLITKGMIIMDNTVVIKICFKATFSSLPYWRLITAALEAAGIASSTTITPMTV